MKIIILNLNYLQVLKKLKLVDGGGRFDKPILKSVIDIINIKLKDMYGLELNVFV